MTRARRWTRTEESIALGSGPEVFDRAARALFSWEFHRSAGLRVEGPARVEPLGSREVTATLHVRCGPVTMRAPVRLVAVERTSLRAAFTYRALPGHPEEGEETFAVTVDDAAGTVRFTLDALSRPGPWWARVGAPMARAVQRRITARYLEAALRAVR